MMADQPGRYEMNRELMLIIASLLSILLITLHVTDDIVRGFDAAGPANLIGILIAGVWLCGTLLLNRRLAGYIIMLLGGIFALGMPLIHLRGTHIGETVRSAGGYFFLWTLFALGILGIFCIVLTILQLWALRSRMKREAV